MRVIIRKNEFGKYAWFIFAQTKKTPVAASPRWFDTFNGVAQSLLFFAGVLSNHDLMLAAEETIDLMRRKMRAKK